MESVFNPRVLVVAQSTVHTTKHIQLLLWHRLLGRDNGYDGGSGT